MAKYKAIMVFLLAMTIILSIFIFMNGLSAFRASKEQTESTLNPSIDCVEYIYSVSNVKYEGSVLSLKFENKPYSNRDVSNITIRSDTNISKTVQAYLPRGGDFTINLPEFQVSKNFTIYPDTCRVYAKTCFLSSGECKGYDPPSYIE